MSLESWMAFVGIWILAGIPLGPNALNCIATSASEGFHKSLLCIVGILLAAMLFIFIVSSGFSVVLVANTKVFAFIKIMGAAYLIWMGINLWKKDTTDLQLESAKSISRFEIVKNSFFISVSNPKAILSYGAVFSQFVDQTQPLNSQLLVLAPTALCIVAIIYLGYCRLGLGVGRFLSKQKRLRMFNRSIGTAYIAGGVAILGIESSPNSRISP